MPGTRHHLAPAMPIEQAIDGAVIDTVPDALFKCLPDLPDRRDLPTFGLGQKGSKEFFLFFLGEILSSSASLAWRFNCRDAETIVTGDDRMNRCFGHAAVPRNLLCLSRLNQRIVNNQPALPTKGAGVIPHPVFHFCQGQMGSCIGHSCHVLLSPLISPSPKDVRNTEMVRSDLLVSRAAQAPERHVVPTFTPRLNGWRSSPLPPETLPSAPMSYRGKPYHACHSQSISLG